MSLTERLSELVRACFTGLWIESHEHEDALAEVATLCRSEEWRLATWDIEEGLRLQGQDSGADTGTNDPLAAIRALSAFAASSPFSATSTIAPTGLLISCAIPDANEPRAASLSVSRSCS